jgi:hypothetical protein
MVIQCTNLAKKIIARLRAWNAYWDRETPINWLVPGQQGYVSPIYVFLCLGGYYIDPMANLKTDQAQGDILIKYIPGKSPVDAVYLQISLLRDSGDIAQIGNSAGLTRLWPSTAKGEE